MDIVSNIYTGKFRGEAGSCDFVCSDFPERLGILYLINDSTKKWYVWVY